ncbi:unnamed protein product, partial [Mesorhabditis spiculigera]
MILLNLESPKNHEQKRGHKRKSRKLKHICLPHCEYLWWQEAKKRKKCLSTREAAKRGWSWPLEEMMPALRLPERNDSAKPPRLHQRRTSGNHPLSIVEKIKFAVRSRNSYSFLKVLATDDKTWKTLEINVQSSGAFGEKAQRKLRKNWMQDSSSTYLTDHVNALMCDNLKIRKKNPVVARRIVSDANWETSAYKTRSENLCKM